MPGAGVLLPIRGAERGIGRRFTVRLSILSLVFTPAFHREKVTSLTDIESTETRSRAGVFRSPSANIFIWQASSHKKGEDTKKGNHRP